MYDHFDICSLFSKKAPSYPFASSGCLNFTLLFGFKAPAPSSSLFSAILIYLLSVAYQGKSL